MAKTTQNAAAKASARGLRQSAAKEERKVESKTGKPLEKGEDRVIERSLSSDGQDPGEKQD